MKGNKKRILSFLVAMVMLLGMIPVTAVPAKAEEKGACIDVTVETEGIVTYDGEATDVAVSVKPYDEELVAGDIPYISYVVGFVPVENANGTTSMKTTLQFVIDVDKLVSDDVMFASTTRATLKAVINEYKKANAEGLNAETVKKLFDALNKVSSIDVSAVNALMKVIEAVECITEDDGPVMVSITDEYPSNVGVYVIGAVAWGEGFETAMGMSYLAIKPETANCELEFDYQPGKSYTKIPANRLKKLLNVTVTEKETQEEVDVLLGSLFFGVGVDAEGRKLVPYFKLNSVEGMSEGIYGQLSFMLDYTDSTIHYAMPIARLIVVNPAEELDVKLNASLMLEKEVHIVIYAKVTGHDDLDLTKNMGLLVWSDDEAEAVKIEGSEKMEDGRYAMVTSGIPAKKLGDTVNFKVYVDLGDGEYEYSEAKSYSPKQYAEKVFTTTNVETGELAYPEGSSLRELCEDMLNYGAAAQVVFNYNTDALVNADLADSDKELDWDDELVSKLENKFEADDIFTAASATLGLEGALDFYFRFTIDADLMETAQKYGIMRWSKDTYNADKENAEFGELTLLADGRYQGVYPGVAAKEYKDVVYVCAYVVDALGITHYSDVMMYNVESYIASALASENASDAVKEVVKALAVYSQSAKEHFNY